MGIAELGQPLARDGGGEGSPRQTRAGALGGRVGPSFWQGATGLVISTSSCAWREGPGSRCRHCPQPPRAACSAIPRGQSGSLHLWERGGRAAGAGVWQRSPLRGQQGGQEHRARPSSREGRVPGWWCAPPRPALTQLLAPPYNRQSLRHPTPSTWGLRRCPRVGSLSCTAGKSSGLCPGPGPHTHVPKCHSSRPQSMSC